MTNRDALLGIALIAAGCATTNTPYQEEALRRWKACESRFPTASLGAVRPDGSVTFNVASPADLAGVQECFQKATPATVVDSRPQRVEPSKLWGYTIVSPTMASYDLLAYFDSKIDCEAAQAKDTFTHERDTPYLKARVAECRRVEVGHGEPYWISQVRSSRPYMIGAATREMCDRLREAA